MFASLRRAAAFTLIEVLVVVVILGILGGIVVPSMLTAGELGIQGAARTVLADLILAQNEAVAAQATRTVYFDLDNDRYGILDEDGVSIESAWFPQTDTRFVVNLGNGAFTTADQAGRHHVVDFRAGTRFTGVDLRNATFAGPTPGTFAFITFDALGSPTSGGGSVELSFDRRVYRINVADFTGRMELNEIN